MLDHQPLTLLVAVGTLGLTVFLYIVIPKGFFPVQDTGLIQGISEAAAVGVVRGDGRAPAGLGGADPQRPRRRQPVFVHRRRRHQHDPEQRPLADQSEAARRAQHFAPATSSGGCERETRCRRHHALHAAGPGSDDRRDGQPLAIPVLCCRTPTRASSQSGSRNCCERLQQIPQLEDVTSNYAENGLSAYVLIDRATAARFGITPATVDNALYDSFGQRIVSTIFTQSNQYRVILEADPSMQQSLSSLGLDLSAVIDRGERPGAAVGDRPGRRSRRRRCRSTISASFRRRRSRSIWRPAPRSARRSTRSSRPSRRSACRPA